MSKKLFGKFFILLLVVGLLFAAAPTGQAFAQTPSVWDGIYPAAKPAGMLDPASGVQEVWTAEEFAWLASQTNMFQNGVVNTVKLMVDIDLNNKPWTPSIALGQGEDNGYVLDGNGKTISNLSINVYQPGTFVYAGMFVKSGDAIPMPTIRNLTIDGATVTGTSDEYMRIYAGVLSASDEWRGNFENITITDAVVTGSKYVGGIAAYAEGNFINCSVTDTTLVVNEKLANATTRTIPHVGALVGLLGGGQVKGNTIDNFDIDLTPPTGYDVPETQIGALIGTAQASVLVGSNSVSDVTLNDVIFTKLIGLDNRTLKVVNATQMLGYTTIQDAIDAAAAGDTIMVAAGTYTGQININKPVSIIGSGRDGANATIITSTAYPTVLLGATGTVGSPVLLQNLQIQGTGGIRTTVTPIDYFTMDNVWLLETGTGGEGFRLVTGHQMTHLTITNSIIEGFTDGIIIEKTPGTGDLGTKLQHVTVTDTIFKNNHRKGLYIETLSDAVFTNVQLIDNGYYNAGASLAEYNSAGFDLNLKDGDYSNLQFINMTATGNGLYAKDGAALMIKARSDGATYSLHPATLDGVLISGGSFTGNERGIRFGEPNASNAGPTNVVITGATLLGNVKTYTGTDGSAYGDVVNLSLATVNATENWWGSADGPVGGQIVGDVAYCAWLNAAPPDGEPVAYPVINTTTHEGFCTIQAAIDDADTDDGDTITVAAGLYEGFLYIYKDISLLGPNAGISPNGVTPRVGEAIIKGPSDDWLAIYANVDGVTIDGFTIDGEELALNTNGYNAGIFGVADNFLVQNNIFSNFEDGMAIYTYGGRSTYLTGISVKNNKMENTTPGAGLFNFGMYLQSSVGTVSGNVVNNYRAGIQIQPYFASGNGFVQDNYFRTYRLGMYFNYTEVATANWLFEGNDVAGIAHPAGLTPERYNAIRVETFYEGNVDFKDNSILLGTSDALEKYQYIEVGVTNGVSDATLNYWGSPCGPTAFSGLAGYSPWYADEAMTTLATGFSGSYTFPDGASTADMNATIACAVPGSTLTFNGSYPGGIVVPEDRYGLTFKLNGSTVGPGSSAFAVYGDTITIEGPGVLDGTGDLDSSPAILVGSGVSNFTVSKLEILNWADGVQYAGAITNTQVVDNFIHDNTGHAVYFAVQPTVETPVSFYIQGNLFKHNGGDGVYNAGGTPVNAEFNSWSDYAGVDGTDGDEATSADTDPFTHVDLYMVSTNPVVDNWPNQVFVDDADPLTPYDTITYQVKAHMENVTGASFVLEFDPGLIEVKEIVNNNYFPWPFNDEDYDGTVLDENITYNNTEGWIAFDGASLTEVDGDIVLFEVTFTGLLPGEVVLDFDEDTDEFTMAPGYGPSVNIYADELVDATLDVITRPTLEITGLDTPFVAGLMSHEIINEICNASTGGLWDESPTEPDAIGWIRISDITEAEIASLQFLYGGVWYDFEVQAGDVIQQVGEDVIARFGNYDFGFDIQLDWCDIDAFRVTFVEPGFHDVSVSIYDMMDTPYDYTDDLLLVETDPVTITVLGGFDVLGTISMQGRAARYGVPLTLTDVNGEPIYGPIYATSTSELAYNVLFSPVNGSIYEITTNQARYLNVTEDLNKQFLVNGAYTIEALELKGGNAMWENHATSNNKIDIFDASEVGSHYGEAVDQNADVNFDGKVNIQDLALVGGNFDLTNAEAYADWLPTEYNGSVSGIMTEEVISETEVLIHGSVSGDYNLTIEGFFTGESGGFATFYGDVTGDFTGTIEGTVYERGTDPLYAIITDTDADQTVRLVGAFVKSGINGHFVGEIITGPELAPVTSVTISGDTTVAVGNTIDLNVTTDPADRWVIWSVHANHTAYASIDQNGVLTGLAESTGPIEIIVVVIDDSGFSSKSHWVTVTAP